MKNKKILIIILALVISTLQISAQNISSVTWSLYSPDSNRVSSIVGNILGQTEIIGPGPNGMTVASYNTNGQRLNQGSLGWIKETAQNDTRFIQFDASPSTGFDLTATNISFNYGWAGSTSSMNSNVYYSIDNWVTRTQLNSDIGPLVYGNSSGLAYSKNVNIAVANGKIFSIRIYPFWVGTTNTSTSKYAVHNTFVITGLTKISGSTSPLTVSTNSVTNVTYNSAVSGGNVVADGGSSVTARGVCWNTSGSPTISDNKTLDGTGLGIFTSTITGLTAKTKYYLRAYATNSSETSYGSELSFTTLDPPILSFPGADGFGKYTTGGRGGAVYEVTNLNDDGSEGTLRWAVNQTGARTIVFRVSGTIQLKSALSIKNDNLTIAGQTAPGDGICLRDYDLYVSANNVILRFIRSRLGDVTRQESDAVSGFDARNNIIIDHCSFSWSIDETASFYGNTNFTMQWCIASESLNHSYHSKGDHGYGGIWGGSSATYHHNLLAHHNSRNPRFAGGETSKCINLDFRNNVIYNWSGNSTYGGEESFINMVNNYYKAGPATTSKANRILELADNTSTNSAAGKFFIDGNYVDGYPTITANNWAGGVQGSFANNPLNRSLTPFPFDIRATQSAQDAFNSVLQSAGAAFPTRDAVDTRVLDEVRTGTAHYGATFGGGGKGIIDSQNDVGGWPVLNSTTAPADTDHDGIPDSWEISHGLNPNDANDRNTKNTEGYTMLEVYLNGLVPSALTPVEEEESLPINFSLSQNYPNPFNPSTKINYSLPSESKVRLEVFDLLGRKVVSLVDESKPAGNYSINFDGTHLSSGIYIYRLQTSNQVVTKKMILMK